MRHRSQALFGQRQHLDARLFGELTCQQDVGYGDLDGAFGARIAGLDLLGCGPDARGHGPA